MIKAVWLISIGRQMLINLHISEKDIKRKCATKLVDCIRSLILNIFSLTSISFRLI